MNRTYLFAAAGLAVLGVLLVLYALGYVRLPLNSRRNTLTLKNQTFEVEIADTMAARAQGLSGRESLPRDQGILFIFPEKSRHGFWMKDMNFPIDILWFDGNRLVGITKNAEPEPGVSLFNLKIHYPPQDVDRVLEINAGLSDAYGFEPGDTYELKL